MNRHESKRRPLVGHWELTYDCNLNCQHCFITKDTHKKELSYEEIIKIIDQLFIEGCIHLIFTGGEPFMRRDFMDIYTYAKKKGFLITIFTNGTLLDKENLDCLKKYPPFMIEITLHSLNKHTFDAVTRVNDSFSRCMQAIYLIIERKLPLALKTVGMNLNKHEIYRIRDFVKGLENVKFKFDPFIIPRHDGSKEPLKLRLYPDEVIDIEFSDKEMKSEWQDCVDNIENFIEADSLFGGCRGGLSSFHINPYGQLQLCLMMLRPTFDLKKNSFKEGFYDFLYNLRSQNWQTDSACRQCEISYLCSQCPAKGMVINGNMEAPVDYLCQLAHKAADFLYRQKEKDTRIGKTN